MMLRDNARYKYSVNGKQVNFKCVKTNIRFNPHS